MPPDSPPLPLLRDALLSGANDRSTIRTVRPLGGAGNHGAARVETERGSYVAKWQRGAPPAARVEAEARGLELLRRAASGLTVPLVCGVAANAEGALLLLEWLDSVPPTGDAAARLGEGLARQHQHIGEQYGLDYDNFIGLTPQPNAWHESWPAFFATQRLRPMAARLAAVGRLPAPRARHLDALLVRLPDLLPHDPPPSLLHGDLWGGNWLALPGGGAALIDPAVSFGDREADLAMTRLFGGFPARFYAAYQSVWPLEAGAAERVPLYNLYHLLNHLLLFGEGYGASVDSILAAFA